MEFGICFKGFVSPERARYLVRQAEVGGFTYCWFFDSHILWRDCYAAIAMCMEHTKKFDLDHALPTLLLGIGP